MQRSIEMVPKKYPSFGKCIFCGATENLTTEHIVPEGLTGKGEMVIENGSCRRCNNYANEAYEQPALKADFLPVRHMLQLRRKRRGRKTSPRKMPPVSLTAVAPGPDVVLDQELPPENYPPLCEFICHEPAGLLLGVDRSGDKRTFRALYVHLGLPGTRPQSALTRHTHVMGAPEKVAAKMAYCWAVAEKGLGAFDTTDLLDLLCGRRDDVFNFVGSPVEPERLAKLHLHKFYFRKRGDFVTVLVHLFASFDGPLYEIVKGRER